MNLHRDSPSHPRDGQKKTKGLDFNGEQALDTGNVHRSKALLVPRLMASLLSLILVVMGVVAILTGHYSARSARLGGVEISLEGVPALVMGISTIFLGLFPLLLWFRTKRARVIWGIACLVAAGAAFWASVSLQPPL